MDGTHHGAHDDSGIALVIAIGVIALMVLLATGAFYIASQTLFDTQMATRHDAAFQAASSGVVVAFTSLRSQIASGTVPPGTTVSGSITASAAVYTAVATLNGAGTAYECTSTGTATDGVAETVFATFAITPPSTSWLPFGYNVFFFGGSSVGSVNGSGLISGPYFILYPPPVPPATFPTITFSGDMQLSGGPIYVQNGNFSCSKAATSPVLVYTNGSVNGSMANGVDTGSHFIRMPLEATATLSVTRVVGSFLTTSLANATAQSSDNLMGDTTTTNQEVAQVGVPSTYRWQRAPNVVATGPYKVIGTSSSPVGLTINSNTNSFGSIAGSIHDDFAYNKATGILYVEGTVYVWGKLTISRAITYVGNGTIVCTGDLEINANVVPATSGNQPDATHILGIFTGGDANFPTNAVTCVGAFYAVGKVYAPKNNLALWGSFISEQGISAGGNSLNITSIPDLGNYVSAGLPHLVSESSGTSGSSGLQMTSWRRR
jgi:hypothetical protein